MFVENVKRIPTMNWFLPKELTCCLGNLWWPTRKLLDNAGHQTTWWNTEIAAFQPGRWYWMFQLNSSFPEWEDDPS